MTEYFIDQRWKDMWAHIGEPLLYDIDRNWPPKGVYVDFEIHVKWDGQLFNSKIRMLRSDFEDFRYPADVYEFILDEMIEFVDKYMDHWDMHHEHLDYVR